MFDSGFRTLFLTRYFVVFVCVILLVACGSGSDSSSAAESSRNVETTGGDEESSQDVEGTGNGTSQEIVLPAVRSIETDAGLVTNGRINDSSVVFHGVATPLSQLQLALNGAVAGSSLTDESGQWMLDYRTVPLSPGNYNVTLQSITLDGRVIVSENPYQFQYDPNATDEPTTAIPPQRGLIISSADPESGFGWALAGSGDLNGDGFEDWALAAPDSQQQRGEIIVLWGQAAPMAQKIQLPLAPQQGFGIVGAEVDDQLGRSLAVGDLNGDGIDDLVIAAPGSDAGAVDAGAIYIIWGVSGRNQASINLQQFTSTQGFVVTAKEAGQRLGDAATTPARTLSLGDFNADGVQDLLIGHPLSDVGGDNCGAAYLIWGEAQATANNLELTDVGLNRRGFTLRHASSSGWQLGHAAQFVRDVNADGVEDLALGAPQANLAAQAGGAVFVVYGSVQQKPNGVVDLSTLDTDSGRTIVSFEPNGFLGSVVTAAEFNGDGIADLVVSQPQLTGPRGESQGAVHVVYGGRSGNERVDVDLMGRQQGGSIFGAAGGDHLGLSISDAGDFNGDGLDDLILGAYRKTTSSPDNGLVSQSGAAYLVLGSRDPSQTLLPLENFSAVQGLWFSGSGVEDWLGFSVSNGDFNGDGFADIALGVPGASQVHIHQGRALSADVVQLEGDGTGNKIVGTSTADQISGNGGVDAISAGAGNDSIAVSDTDFFRIAGGRGFDTLQLVGQNLNLDLTQLNPESLSGIEAIDLQDQGNVLALNRLALLRVSSEQRALWVEGGASDRLDADTDDGWLQLPDFTQSGVIYRHFSASLADLYVNAAIDLAPDAELLASQNYWFDTTANGADVAVEVTNVPVLIRITDRAVLEAVQPGAEDIRFVDADGVTRLPYEVERWDQANGIAEIWVLVPQIDGNSDQDFITLQYDDMIDGSVANGENPDELWADYSGVWHFNTRSGNLVVDSSPANNDGIAQGSINQQQRFIGEAVRFTDQGRIRVPFTPSLDLSQRSFSIETWYSSNTCETALLLSRRTLNILSQDGESYWGLKSARFLASITILDSEVRRASFMLGDANGETTVSGGSLIGLFVGDCLEQVVSTYDPQRGTRIYINGELKTQSPELYPLGSNNDLILGGDAGNYELVLDETRLSRRQLEPGFIKLSYENQKQNSRLIRTSP